MNTYNNNQIQKRNSQSGAVPVLVMAGIAIVAAIGTAVGAYMVATTRTNTSSFAAVQRTNVRLEEGTAKVTKISDRQYEIEGNICYGSYLQTGGREQWTVHPADSSGRILKDTTTSSHIDGGQFTVDASASFPAICQYSNLDTGEAILRDKNIKAPKRFSLIATFQRPLTADYCPDVYLYYSGTWFDGHPFAKVKMGEKGFCGPQTSPSPSLSPTITPSVSISPSVTPSVTPTPTTAQKCSKATFKGQVVVTGGGQIPLNKHVGVEVCRPWYDGMWCEIEPVKIGRINLNNTQRGPGVYPFEIRDVTVPQGDSNFPGTPNPNNKMGVILHDQYYSNATLKYTGYFVNEGVTASMDNCAALGGTSTRYSGRECIVPVPENDCTVDGMRFTLSIPPVPSRPVTPIPSISFGPPITPVVPTAVPTVPVPTAVPTVPVPTEIPTSTPTPTPAPTIEGRISVYGCQKPSYTDLFFCTGPDQKSCRTLSSNRGGSEKTPLKDGVWLDDNNNDNTWIYRYKISKDKDGNELVAGQDYRIQGTKAWYGNVHYWNEPEDTEKLTMQPGTEDAPSVRDFEVHADRTCGCTFESTTTVRECTDESCTSTRPLSALDGQPTKYGLANNKQVFTRGDKPVAGFSNGGTYKYSTNNLGSPIDPQGYGRDALAWVKFYAPDYQVKHQWCKSNNPDVPSCPGYTDNWEEDATGMRNPEVFKNLRLTCNVKMEYGFDVVKVTPTPTLPPQPKKGNLEVLIAIYERGEPDTCQFDKVIQNAPADPNGKNKNNWRSYRATGYEVNINGPVSQTKNTKENPQYAPNRSSLFVFNDVPVGKYQVRPDVPENVSGIAKKCKGQLEATVRDGETNSVAVVYIRNKKDDNDGGGGGGNPPKPAECQKWCTSQQQCQEQGKGYWDWYDTEASRSYCAKDAPGFCCPKGSTPPGGNTPPPAPGNPTSAPGNPGPGGPGAPGGPGQSCRGIYTSENRALAEAKCARNLCSPSETCTVKETSGGTTQTCRALEDTTSRAEALASCKRTCKTGEACQINQVNGQFIPSCCGSTKKATEYTTTCCTGGQNPGPIISVPPISLPQNGCLANPGGVGTCISVEDCLEIGRTNDGGISCPANSGKVCCVRKKDTSEPQPPTDDPNGFANACADKTLGARCMRQNSVNTLQYGYNCGSNTLCCKQGWYIKSSTPTEHQCIPPYKIKVDFSKFGSNEITLQLKWSNGSTTETVHPGALNGSHSFTNLHPKEYVVTCVYSEGGAERKCPDQKVTIVENASKTEYIVTLTKTASGNSIDPAQADLNNDGEINTADYLLLLDSYGAEGASIQTFEATSDGPAGTNTAKSADITGDGIVNAEDLSFFLTALEN